MASKFLIYTPRPWNKYATNEQAHQYIGTPIDPDCILFKEKEYPLCTSCKLGYLPQLGCLWCQGKTISTLETI